MVIVVALALLVLSLGCLAKGESCAAHANADGLEPLETDSYRRLEAHLRATTNETDLRTNLPLVREFVDPPVGCLPCRLSRSNVLAIKIATLSLARLCEPDQMTMAREAATIIASNDRCATGRLSKLMAAYLDEARQVCVARFAAQWTRGELGAKLDETFKDSLALMGVAGGPPAPSEDSARGLSEVLRGLGNALRLRPGLLDNQAAASARKALDQMWLNKRQEPLLRNPQGARLTKMRRLVDSLNASLLKPCATLIDRFEARTVLKPMGELGTVVELADLKESLGPEQSAASLVEWSSRYLTCEWLLSVGAHQLGSALGQDPL